MKSTVLLVIVMLITCGTNGVYGQEPEMSSSAGSLQEQFEILKETSNNYQEYEVIKRTALDSFFSTVQDSIDAAANELQTRQDSITILRSKLQANRDSLNRREEQLKTLQFQTSHINALGIDFEKGNFKVIVWVIILALAIGLAILWYKFKESHKISNTKKRDYQVLEEEYNNFRQKAREKEVKLKRELQTELNRNEDLSQKLAALRK